jgi:hypothetical protein
VTKEGEKLVTTQENEKPVAAQENEKQEDEEREIVTKKKSKKSKHLHN